MTSSSHTPDKRTVKEMYRHSAERVSNALKFLGSPRQDGPTTPLTEQEFEAIHNCVNGILGSHSFEEENDYKTAIADVGGWVLHAFTREFIEAHAGVYPQPLYVIRKGLEMLHTLIHRDLRRRQLSLTESQLYHEFRQTCSHLPDPRREKLSQNDIDSLIDAQAKGKKQIS